MNKSLAVICLMLSVIAAGCTGGGKKPASQGQKPESAQSKPAAEKPAPKGPPDLVAFGIKYCNLFNSANIAGLLDMFPPEAVNFARQIVYMSVNDYQGDPWQHEIEAKQKALKKLNPAACETVSASEKQCEPKMLGNLRRFGVAPPENCGEIILKPQPAPVGDDSIPVTDLKIGRGILNLKLAPEKLVTAKMNGQWFIINE